MSFIRQYFSCIFLPLFLYFGVQICNGIEFNDGTVLFAQSWPLSFCTSIMSKSRKHDCILSQNITWTIHGIWPNNIESCRRERFDKKAVKQHWDQLHQHWGTQRSRMNSDGLWRHEWEKHGVCGGDIEEINTQEKYFGQGLSWHKQYSIDKMLSEANIIPGAYYNLIDIHNAIFKGFQANPFIACEKDKYNAHIQYLSEIRLCFDKKLTPKHCRGRQFRTDSGESVITDCNFDRMVVYPKSLPDYLIDMDGQKPTDSDNKTYVLLLVLGTIPIIIIFILCIVKRKEMLKLCRSSNDVI